MVAGVDAFISAAAAYGNARKMSGLTDPGSSAAMGLAPAPAALNDSQFFNIVKGVVGESINSLRHSEKISAAALVDKAPLHEVVTQINEAEIALQTVVAIRDKAIGAYQDILRMPI
ncbi:MAG: fliE [Rickettsiales bacterium]|jgi:flagellar hook-basal body complex protein FliE|nr:fliE [Rickettsiales bacterium]